MRAATLLVVAATVATVACADVWWKSAVVYQIYPRSFKDSNNDGVGDLNGIKEKLPYLQELGVDAIWLSPIYKSPMVDFGYDITDYKSIDPIFGTMNDFRGLVQEAKRLGIRVVLDFVPNHTSPESEWFQKSVKRENPYTDYYVWADGPNKSSTIPPSNWISIFSKSAWEYHPIRQQFYLHQFVIGQPDLNYRSKDVQEEMKNVLRFWLDEGVSGFRVDAVNMMYEVDPAQYGGNYPNEPPSGENVSSDDYAFLNHPFTKDQNETYNVVYEWRQVLDSYTTANESKMMVTEAYTDLDLILRYYGNGTHEGSVPFNFEYLGKVRATSNAKDFKKIVDDWMNFMPAGRVANWVNGNHDQRRMSTRYGVKRIDAMNMLALILPGLTFTYQGEELGMTDEVVSWAMTQDPQSCNAEDPLKYYENTRDPSRSPFHWDDSPNAGFSTASTTWLPVVSNYKTVNVAVEKAASKSHYHFYRDVIALKHTPAIKSGKVETYAISNDILLVTRMVSKEPGVLGLINLSGTTTKVDLSKISGVSSELTVVASGIDCTVNKGAKVQKNNVMLSGNCAMALQSPPIPAAPGAAHRYVASLTMCSVTFFLFGYLL